MSMTATKRRRLCAEKEKTAVKIAGDWWLVLIFRDPSEPREIFEDWQSREIRISHDIPVEQRALKIAQCVSRIWAETLARQFQIFDLFPR